jgi:long-chain acyl-CoA synthetase
MHQSPSSLVDLFLRRLAESPDCIALRTCHQQQVRELTWRQIGEDVQRVVGVLMELGIQPGDRVAQLSENRYEWIVTDLAILLSRAVHVPIHAPLAAEQVSYQVEHSGSRLLVVSGKEQQAKIAAVSERLPRQLQLAGFECGTGDLAGRPLRNYQDWLRSKLLPAAAATMEQASRQTTPEALATILYTSGTTGQPKGVMLSHRNLVTNACETARMFHMSADDVRLCFLPLSHIFARTCDLYTWVAMGNQLCLATSRDTVLDDCQWARPTVISGVPYFYDRVYRVACSRGLDKQPGGLRQLLGGRIRFCCSGGAALPDHIFDLYQTQGLPILQGYGLTESSPVISVSSPDAFRRGSSGRALTDVEVKIADDGEILTRGPHVMQGYWRDKQATAEILVDGWLHTGDLGRIDEDGFIYITGRKKELIVTSAGKNIAPVLLESMMTEDDLIDQAVVIGDGRNYLTALVVANWAAVRAELPQLADRSDAELREHADVHALFQRQIASRLAKVSYHEQVRRFTLLPRPFSIERHEVTPKLSLRRPIIHEHFREEIEAMYRG